MSPMDGNCWMEIIFFQVFAQCLLRPVILTRFFRKRFIGIDENWFPFYGFDYDPLRVASINGPVATTKHILKPGKNALPIFIAIKEHLGNYFPFVIGKGGKGYIINRWYTQLFGQVNIFGRVGRKEKLIQNIVYHNTLVVIFVLVTFIIFLYQRQNFRCQFFVGFNNTGVRIRYIHPIFQSFCFFEAAYKCFHQVGSVIMTGKTRKKIAQCIIGCRLANEFAIMIESHT